MNVEMAEACGFIEAEISGGTFPGAALVVTQHRRKIVERFWGTYCSLERNGIPYDGSVTNMLYSFSKGISSTVIVMAHQDGFIDYDVPVRTYIPEFAGGGKDVITMRHLLTHSAGLDNANHGSTSTQDEFDNAVQDVCRASVGWAPGSKNLYHGSSAMMIAAEVVRRAYGMRTWDEICGERLFTPLGAKSFTFGAAPLAGSKLAATPVPKQLPSHLDAAHFWQLGAPGAGAFGTIEDVLKVLHLHLNRGVWEGKTLIKLDAYSGMHTIQNNELIEAALVRGENPVREYWGLGWQLRGKSTNGWFGFGDRASPRSFGHAGIDTVMTVADPDRDVAIVFTTTDSPRNDSTIRVRNTVTNLVIDACDR